VELHVDDDGFVRAPAALVYRRLTDVGGVADLVAGHGRAAAASGTGTRRRADRPAGRVLGVRPARRAAPAPAAGRPAALVASRAGVLLALRGDIEGHAEFWLEPGHGGTVVHHLLIARTHHPRPLQVYRDYRRVVRAGLWGCKDLLHLEARTMAGLEP
jgi:hypothetical protein